MAISPQTIEKNAAIQKAHRLEYPVLRDAQNAWATSLSMTHTLPEDLREVYLGFGIDLPAYNGESTWQLPLPARIVITGDGTIRSIDADPDYTIRPEPEATLDVLRSLQA